MQKTILLVFVLLLLTPVYAQPGYRLQEKPNYCGIALMQVFAPQVSQDEIARDLHKWRFDMTYWGDFVYFFNKNNVSYRFSTLNNEFPAIILLYNPRYMRYGHYILVLDSADEDFYYVFDPAYGFDYRVKKYIVGKRALVITPSSPMQ